MAQKISESLVGKGVVLNDLSKYYDGKSAVLMCEPTDYFTLASRGVIVEAWEKEINVMGYDYVGCVGIPFKISKRLFIKNRRKCSHHSAQGYAQFIRFLGKEPVAVSPNDILRFVVYTQGKYFSCDLLDKNKRYRPGTIGIVIDDFSLNALEITIEWFTGDGKHTFNVLGGGKHG